MKSMAQAVKMVAAYAAFSNGGIYYEPQYINKIEFNDGTTQTYSSSGTRAMKRNNSLYDDIYAENCFDLRYRY